MIACIFGASGMVGRQVLYICLHDDRIEKVKVFVRKPLAIKHDKLQQINTNFLRPEEWSHELKDGVVFCSIGTTIGNAGSKAKFTAVDRDIPALIAIEAEKNKCTHFLYVSSVGANSSSPNFYLKTKGQTEELLHKSFKGRLSILRPGMLTGKRLEFRLGETIGKYLMIGVDKITFGLLGKYRPIKALDVARAMIVSAFDGKHDSEILEGKVLHKKAAAY